MSRSTSGSEIDFADAFASGLGAVVLRGFLAIAALWLGFTMGEAALVAGDLAEDFKLDRRWLIGRFESAYMLILVWGFPGALGVAALWFHFVRLDGGGRILWGIFNGLLALAWVGLQVELLDSGWLPTSAALTTCVIEIGMVGTALWFLRQWQMNRWAGELLAVQMENEMRRRELNEKFGTHHAGAMETGIPED